MHILSLSHHQSSLTSSFVVFIVSLFSSSIVHFLLNFYLSFSLYWLCHSFSPFSSCSLFSLHLFFILSARHLLSHTSVHIHIFIYMFLLFFLLTIPCLFLSHRNSFLSLFCSVLDFLLMLYCKLCFYCWIFLLTVESTSRG